jgi:hypothetical protein
MNAVNLVEVVSTSRKESSPINANQFDHNAGDQETPETNNDDEITIKGRSDGVAIELGTGDWSHLVANLDSRLEEAAGFFRGGQVSLNTGPRPLVEPELDQVCAILQKYSLSVGLIRTGSERTFQSAMTLGLASTLDSPDKEVQSEAVYADSNKMGRPYFVYRETCARVMCCAGKKALSSLAMSILGGKSSALEISWSGGDCGVLPMPEQRGIPT